MTPQRLTWHFDNWAEWHKASSSEMDNDLPERSGGGVFQCAPRDFDSLVASSDTRCAEAVEAILEGLPAVQRCAVHHVHLDAVFSFPRHAFSYVVPYEIARVMVAAGLVRRGIP
jgi:hypothetical protein